MHHFFSVSFFFEPYSIFTFPLIEGVKEWIGTCLPRSSINERLLLVWGSFCAHLTDSVKADLQRRRVNIAVIPGGLTLVLQPLDKCLNEPFKDNIRKQYLSWMLTSPFEFTPAGKKKAPSRNLVFRWVKQAWCDIPEEMVRRSSTKKKRLNSLMKKTKRWMMNSTPTVTTTSSKPNRLIQQQTKRFL